LRLYPTNFLLNNLFPKEKNNDDDDDDDNNNNNNISNDIPVSQKPDAKY